MFEPLLKDQKKQEIQDPQNNVLLNNTPLTSLNNESAAASLSSKEPGKQQIAHGPSTFPSLWTKLKFWSRNGFSKEQEGKEKALEATESSERTSLSDGVQQVNTTVKTSKPGHVACKESTAASWWPTWK